MIRNKIAYILLGVTLLPVVFGCREEGTFPPPPSVFPEIPQDLIDAQVRHELAEIGLVPSTDNKAELLLPSAAGTSAPEDIDATLRQAEKITDPHEREHVYIDLVKRLTLLKEYAEATSVVRLLQNADKKDTLLEDIARIRMSGVLQEFSLLQRISRRDAENIQGALESARQIHDPLRRAKSLGNIAFLRANMNDRDGSRETIGEAVNVLRELSDGDPQKVSGLCQLARLLLRLEANEDARKLCREIETLAMTVDAVEDRARILASLAEMLVLLRDRPAAKTVCGKGFAAAEQIGDPPKKLSVLLNLVDVLLRIPVAENPEEQLTDVKRIVLDAATVIPSNIPSAVETPPIFGAAEGEDPLFPHEDMAPLSWAKLKAKKNETLRTLAVMQIWQASLDDVWETIEDIDDVTVRDNVIVETIEMMIATKAWEDAGGWSDEISEPELKKSVRRKIRIAMTEKK